VTRRTPGAASGDLFGGAEPRHSLFFALLPAPEVASAIAGAGDAIASGLPAQAGRPVPVHRLHLTLCWLGEWAALPPSTVAAARLAAERLRQPAFALRLDQAACFGHGEVVWVLCPASPPQALGALHDALVHALLHQGQRPAGGQRFAPHVSLRRRATTHFAAMPAGPVDWPVAELALVHSERGAGGVDYHVLGRWPLLPGEA